MKKIHFVRIDTLFALIVLFFLHDFVHAQLVRTFRTAGRDISVQKFDSEVISFLNKEGISGVSLAIIENGKIAYANSYGYKKLPDSAKVTRNTVFEGASLTKMYLMYVAYRLSDEGRLDLSRPMYLYKENDRLKYDARYKKITPLMILSHTSGIENWEWDNDRDVLEILSDPGAKYVYSGEGYDYLAEVITKILGQSYSRYIDSMILKPLNLDYTYFYYDPSDSTRDFAYGHNIMGESLPKSMPKAPTPASSVNTNAEKYAEFLLSIFNTKRLSNDAVNEMLKKSKLLESDGQSKYYMGNGFFIIESEKDTLINFSGNNPGYRADLLYSVSKKRGFVFLSNSDQGMLLSPFLNRLTTRFDAGVYYKESTFTEGRYLSSLLKLYRNKQSQEMLREVNLPKNRKMNLGVLEELITGIFSVDRGIAEKLAYILRQEYPSSPFVYYAIGIINLRVYKDFELARQNFVKAKELEYDGGDMDYYIKLCDDEIKKVNH